MWHGRVWGGRGHTIFVIDNGYYEEIPPEINCIDAAHKYHGVMFSDKPVGKAEPTNYYMTKPKPQPQPQPHPARIRQNYLMPKPKWQSQDYHPAEPETKPPLKSLDYPKPKPQLQNLDDPMTKPEPQNQYSLNTEPQFQSLDYDPKTKLEWQKLDNPMTKSEPQNLNQYSLNAKPQDPFKPKHDYMTKPEPQNQPDSPKTKRQLKVEPHKVDYHKPNPHELQKLDESMTKPEPQSHGHNNPMTIKLDQLHQVDNLNPEPQLQKLEDPMKKPEPENTEPQSTHNPMNMTNLKPHELKPFTNRWGRMFQIK